MKKIIAIAACAMLAAVTQAASVGWTIMGASAFKNGTYQIFVIGKNGVESVSQITTLIGSGSDASSYAFDSGSVTSAGLASKANTAADAPVITYSGSGTDTYQAFAVLYSPDGKTAANTATVSISMANDSQSKTFTFGNVASAMTNNSFPVGVPEPTAVALIALGLAAMGLKRKVA